MKSRGIRLAAVAALVLSAAALARAELDAQDQPYGDSRETLGEARARRADPCNHQDKSLRLKLDLDSRDMARTSAVCPFTTDGCSRFADGRPWDSASWLHCCEMHDVDYWSGLGGAEERDRSDDRLRACVSERADALLGFIVWSGVKSAKPLNTGKTLPVEYRWGYGWPFVLGDDVLSGEQKRSVAEALPSILPAMELNRRQRSLPPVTEAERAAVDARLRALRSRLIGE